VIAFEIIAAVLALAAIGYLLFALLKPERF
jgi:K+-transporting ATPase KdpF subunit